MKLYPLKPPEPEWEDQICHVCECGHNDIFHEGHEHDSKCTICCCPEYVYEQSLTNLQASDLSKYIEDQAIKHNYIK